MGSASVIYVEEQLRESGMMLLSSHSSVDELIVVLDRAEELLCNIEQAPPISVKKALFPMMKALKADTLLKHSDVDVQISVASCIHEITRITAPKEPYNDDLMKEIFKLTVSALENLSQTSTHRYKKAASITYTIARVKSFLVMVDLECDTLIVDMFEHFLKHSRLNHSEDVLWAMEQIMTIVLDEIEYISFKLLCPLLDSVRKENQNVAPISWELGNRVISKCACKLKPYVGEAVESMDHKVEDFAPIIASLCQNSIATREQNHVKDSPAEGLAVTFQKLGSGSDPAPKSTADDITGQMPKGDATSTSSSKGSRKSVLEAVAAIARKRRQRPISMMNPEEGYDNCLTIREKTSAKIPHRRNSHSLGVYGTPSKIPAEEETHLPSNTNPDQRMKLEANGDKDLNSWLMPSGLWKRKPGDNSPENGSRNKGKDSKWQAKQQTSRKRKREMDSLECGMLTWDASLADKEIFDVATDDKTEEKSLLMSKVFSEDESRSEGTPNMSKSQTKKHSSLRKKGKVSSSDLDSGLHRQDASVLDTEISEVATNEILQMRQLVGNKPSSEVKCRYKGMRQMSNLQKEQQNTERNRRKAAPVNLERDSQDISSTDKEISGVAVNKIMEKTSRRNKVSSGDESHFERTPIPNYSLKRKANKEEESGQCYSVEEIVGRRIRVWWPMDKKYYEGFVRSYDYKKKRYLVVYTDGDVERLNLPKKRWEFIEENNSTPPRKNVEVPEYHGKEHSHERIRNLRSNTPKPIKDTNPYQLVKRRGASSSALRFETADGSSGSQPPMVVKMEDYINSEQDSEATLSETETTLSVSETTL